MDDYWIARNKSKSKWFFGSEDDETADFALLFHIERKKRKLNQTEMALLLGISQPQISAIESGCIQPVPKFVFKIEELLGMETGLLSKCLGYEKAGK